VIGPLRIEIRDHLTEVVQEDLRVDQTGAHQALEARACLQRLVEAGLVEPRGERKGRSWHLSGKTYERLGEKAAYVRQRGFETIQQEQMVLQYVEAHGRITRREAAELCQLGPDQASRLLRRLAGRGELQMHGTRKGAWYARRSS